MAKRAKNIFRQGRSKNFPSCAERAINEIIHGEVGFLIPKEFTGLFSKTTSLLIEESINKDNSIMMSLFALARANLEGEGWAYVGRTYSVEVGISANKQAQFDSYPFDINIQSHIKEIPFDFLIHVGGNLELFGDWHKRLCYNPRNSEPQLLDFKFKISEEGDNVIKLDCYHERRWLRTMRFEFKGVEIKVLEASLS